MSLARNELLSLGFQPSPVTPQWSSRAVLLFHYHRGSRSMERRHHYPSGLMRLSRCRKRSGNYCWCSFQPGDARRLERDGGEIDSTHSTPTHTYTQTNTQEADDFHVWYFGTITCISKTSTEEISFFKIGTFIYLPFVYYAINNFAGGIFLFFTNISVFCKCV